jgi:signal transduction histidine kinase
MDGRHTNLELIFALVTLGMILLALGIISLVFIYQRKIQKKQSEMQELDISYQKGLVNAIIEARETEQRRIALELHDDVGSTLTAIKFSVLSLQMEEKTKETLTHNLNDAIQKVRRISNELLPSILEELGLLTAANSLVKQLNDQLEEVTISIQVVQDPPAIGQTKEVNLAFYRVLQELLNNIIKYADATVVEVWLVQNEEGLEMTISDNGKGFIPNKEVNIERPSLGLRNMESRLQQINGDIAYEKQTKGTKVRVEWHP